MNTELIINKLKECDLKITPQRVLVLKTISEAPDHPTAEDILTRVKKMLPNIAFGTIYNILETLVGKGLVEKISSTGDKMRYDVILRNHHHLLSKNADKIEDYFDEELTGLIADYLENKNIPGFNVSGFKLNISGEFINTGKNK